VDWYLTMFKFDWNDLPSFLAVAREGSLSAAAREAGVTQSTMGRRLQALHSAVGTTLLAKTSSGYALTPAGERILAGVERMECEARAIERAIQGEDHRLEGLVRVTTVEPLGDDVLADVLAEIRRDHPRLVFDLSTYRRAESLLQGNADISLRFAEFTEREVVVRRVGEIAYGVYASAEYLGCATGPACSDGARGHRTIRSAGSDAETKENRWFETLTREAETAFRSNSWTAQVHAAERGLGLAFLPRFVADVRPGLKLLPIEEAPASPIWMGYHEDLRHVRRVKLAADCIAGKLRQMSARLNPRKKMCEGVGLSEVRFAGEFSQRHGTDGQREIELGERLVTMPVAVELQPSRYRDVPY
jgi:DNA-binding transcriptional LysR family regulator